jgi:hypothetical protein
VVVAKAAGLLKTRARAVAERSSERRGWRMIDLGGE